MVTNGFPKVLIKNDSKIYRKNVENKSSNQRILKQLPQAKLSNYCSVNNRRLKLLFIFYIDSIKSFKILKP